MPPSMRRQTQNRKSKHKLNLQRVEARRNTVKLLREQVFSVRDIASMTNVPRSTVAELKKMVETKDNSGIQRKLDKNIRPGRNPVLSIDEEKMIVDRLINAGSRGFAIGVDGLKDMMSRIAADGRSGWKHFVPSDDAIRAFRSRNRELTYRRTESKEHAKLAAENFHHCDRFFAILEDLNSKHEGLLSNPKRIINLDETAVNATYGKRKKAFTASNSHHGAFEGESTTYGSNQHITAVIIASACGRVAPPFFIVAGKRRSERWWSPVKGSFGDEVSGICSKYTKPNWMPGDAVIKVSENGSMEKDILTAVVQHMNKFVRTFNESESYLLCLDGHSSRKGTEWIDRCKDNDCEAVIQPANTSHILQPCDQTINWHFKRAIRELRDAFRLLGPLDTRQVNFNLACAVHAYESISSLVVTNSFLVTGVYPFERQWAHRFKTRKDKFIEGALLEKRFVEETSHGSTTCSVRKRQTDSRTMAKVREIIENSKQLGPSRTLQELTIALRNAETVNSILMGTGSAKTVSTAVSNNPQRYLTFDAGAPAECVTHDEVLRQRREKEAADAKAESERQQRKTEKERKRLNRIKADSAQRENRAREQARKQQSRKEIAERNRAEKTKRAGQAAVRRIEADKSKKLAKEAKELTSKLVKRAVEERRSARRNSTSKVGLVGIGKKKQRQTSVRTVGFVASLVVEALMTAEARGIVNLSVRD